ncbi:MAG: hypothetical protein IJP61_05320 [Treponema sp.]|nr:hypothetical protein [Treponema sp.]
MTRKERTFVFNICVGIFNIILGLVIEGFLIFSCMFIIAGLSEEAQQSIPVTVLLPFVLIIGLFASIAISRKSIIWFLDKFDYREKLDPALSAKYQRKL